MSRKLMTVAAVIATIIAVGAVSGGESFGYPWDDFVPPAAKGRPVPVKTTESPARAPTAVEIDRSIQAYLSSGQSKAITAFGRLTIRVPDVLDLKPLHGEGYSSYELMCGDVLGGESGCPKLSVYNPHEAGRGKLGWQKWDWQAECGKNVPKRQRAVTVGGKSAAYYVAGRCRFWEAADAFIYTVGPPGSTPGNVASHAVASIIWK